MSEKEKKNTKRTKTPASGCVSGNGREMFEMMQKCCAGGIPDCSGMMKRRGKAGTPRAKNR